MIAYIERRSVMSVAFIRKKHPLSLRSFVTIAVSLIVTLILLCTAFFYYNRSASFLRGNSQEMITRRLEQVNQQILDQIDAIDSLIPLFLANNLIQTALENPRPAAAAENSRFSVERQISYIYYSSPLSGRNFINSIYLIQPGGNVCHTYTSGSLENVADISRRLLEAFDLSEPHLMCRTLSDDPAHIYFARNLYSGNNGRRTGLIIFHIDGDKWMRYCSSSLEDSWSITLYNQQFQLFSDPDMAAVSQAVREEMSDIQDTSFREVTAGGSGYFVAARTLKKLGLTAAVAAPRDPLLKDLNSILKSYLLLLAGTVLMALAAAIIISRAITRPIEKMVFQINEISSGRQNTLPPMKLYREFDLWTDAFNQMLRKLDASYNENFQKQLLLKNAEIQALQSQMDPHFLFNTLNTIAWKAQIADNEEIYQMVISLGELLKRNTLSRDRAFIELEKEMEYVKFYLYLQQMRFEDITCDIQIPQQLSDCQIPCFCIQPLVENAVIHGLEPKKGSGRLVIQIWEKDPREMEICIADNGVGFEQIPDVRSISSSDEDSHTHIGLKNLDKRLELLFGPGARLSISSRPDVCTTVSFTIPIRRESD